MRTTADEKIDNASSSVTQAIKDLHAVLVEECHGHDEFYDTYKGTLYEAYAELIDIKRRLNR